MERRTGPEKKTEAAARIAFIVLCVLVGEWIFPRIFGHKPWAFSGLVLAILIFGFLTHRALHETPSDLDLRLDNFLGAVWLLVPFVGLAIVLLLIIGLSIGSLAAFPSLSLLRPKFPSGGDTI